ncbi:MAG: dihydrolipoamide acetyltransferase family protein [Thermomicrobiales bacterium]
MPSDVLMPKMGYDMTEGKILRWLKKEGEPVKRGESLAEIETDKVNIEIEAFATGTLGQIVGREGEMIPVGQKIAVILGEGETATNGASEAKAAAPAQPAPAAQADTGEVPRQPATPTPAAEQQTAAGTQAREAVAAPVGPEGRIKASPLARRIAQEHELDLSQIKGSGPGGRIVREDVQAALQTAPAPAQPAAPAPTAPAAMPAEEAPAAARQAPLTRMRAAIGRRMVESKTTIPHFYVSAEVDMTEALAWRKRLNDAAQAEDYKITVNDLIVKACGLALTKFPNINASFGGDHIEMHDQIDISIAVALKEGLIAPVVRGVDKKSLGVVAREAADLVGRAREGKLTPDEFSGGTFTVSNLGPYNIETFIAIITPPQAAALAVASSAQKAVVVDGQIVIRDRMNITISADHRVTDGAEGAQFVSEVRRLLENPLMLLM